MTVFSDAGGWLSVLIENDRFHAVGKAYFQRVLLQRAVMITTDYILDEVVTRLRYDISHRKAAEFLSLVRQSENSGALKVHSISLEIRQEAEAIFLKYPDARLSFTDCTSFAFLARHPADEVFGYDSHFEMMGYLLQPK